MTVSVRDRVFSAAEMISLECPPTVSMVQAASGVSNSEASQYLEEWAKEQKGGLDQSPLNLRANPEQVSRLLHEPSSREQANKTSESQVASVAEDAGKTNRTDVKVAEATARIGRLEKALALLEKQFQQAQADWNNFKEPVGVSAKLAAAEARGDSWLQAYDSLLQQMLSERRSQRVLPVDPRNDEGM